MKLLICVVTLLVLANSAHGAAIQDEDDEFEERAFSKKTERFLKRRCSKYGDEKQLDKALDELAAINLNFIKTLPTHTDADDEELEERCHEVSKEILNGLKRLMDHAMPCLPPEEEYLPEFVQASYKGYSKYLCDHLQVLTLEGLLETNMIGCINKFVRNKKYSPHYQCFQSAKFANQSHDHPISKKEFCEDLDFIYECYKRTFKTQCPDAPEAWEFQEGLLNGLRTPCRENEEENGEGKNKGEKDEEEEATK